jgi:tRNA pseudouridine38-40 synthase
MERRFEPGQLRDAINGNLDPDVRVSAVELVDESFHARYSATQKTYKYRVRTGPVASPFEYRYVYHFRGALDASRMRQAAALLLGRHDFSAFAAGDSEASCHIRDLRSLEVEQIDDALTIVAAANGFLRYMVRTIAGTLIDVGRGYSEAESVLAALEERDRRLAGPTAPAAGLTLLQVDY